MMTQTMIEAEGLQREPFEAGIRTDAENLKRLREAFDGLLQTGSTFTSSQSRSDAWNGEWHQRWDRVDEILTETKSLVNDLARDAACVDAEHIARAAATWAAIQSQDDRLQEAMRGVRGKAQELSQPDRKSWNGLAREIESQFDAIHSCEQALRIKLEKFLSQIEAESRPTQSEEPSESEGSGDALYDHEFRKAVMTVGQEKHQYLGIRDALKSLLMWVESPAERVRRDRLLVVEE